MRRRRILSTRFVARMEDAGRSKSVMFGKLMGDASCVVGPEKEWMRCFLDDFRAFGTSANQWTTTAQDEGGWRKTVEKGAERFMAE